MSLNINDVNLHHDDSIRQSEVVYKLHLWAEMVVELVFMHV